MKKLTILFLLTLCLFGNSLYAQYPLSELPHLQKALKTAKEDTAKWQVLISLTGTYFYAGRSMDSVWMYLNEANALAVKLKNNRLIARTQDYIAVGQLLTGNYSESLKTWVGVLKMYENMKDTSGIAHTYSAMGDLYDDMEDTKMSAYYYKKSYVLYKKLHNYRELYNVENSVGYEYILLNMPDSALPYFQEVNTYSIHHQNGDSNLIRLSFSDYGLGKINYMLGNPSIALPYYRKSLEACEKSAEGKRSYIRQSPYMGLGELFKAAGEKDSAIFYYSKALGCIDFGSKLMVDIYKNLSSLYEGTDEHLALMYLEKAVTLRDSLFDAKKKNEIQNMTFNEQERQKAITEKQKQDEEQQKENLQYASIALGIVVFIFLFLLLSRKIITNTKIIELLGVMVLLIVFEFMNLLLHSFLEKLTNSTPLLMLAALVAIAALLVPLHHRVEKWATHTLLEKNKKIRLAEAKKTIEKLEKET